MTREQDLRRTPSAGLQMNRRSLLKGATVSLATGAASVLPSLARADGAKEHSGTASSRGDAVIARAGQAIVEIATGRIAGSLRNGIFSFKGLPYGDTTEGVNRFWPAAKTDTLVGDSQLAPVRAGLPAGQGHRAAERRRSVHVSVERQRRGRGLPARECVDPGINDNKKRPVMVWLHGGGFAAGSGHDLPAFDGENLARRGDVVVVTLNHRLNLLGFLDLSKYGERYAESANVGMLDIVQALQWVRENIGVLGGDAERVLIFGQSGGGAKVSTLMGMPSAQGLFHRAIVQSGSFALSSTPEKSQRLGELMLLQLGLTASNVDRLQLMPYAELRRASEAVLRMANPPPAGGVIDVRRVGSGLGFGPVTDGKVLPTLPFGPNAPVISADIPMMIGTTLNEFATRYQSPRIRADVRRRARDPHGIPVPGSWQGGGRGVPQADAGCQALRHLVTDHERSGARGRSRSGALESRLAEGARLSVLVHVAHADLRRAPTGLSLRRTPVRLLQHRSVRHHDRRRAAREGVGSEGRRCLDSVRQDGQPQSRGHTAVGPVSRRHRAHPGLR